MCVEILTTIYSFESHFNVISLMTFRQKMRKSLNFRLIDETEETKNSDLKILLYLIISLIVLRHLLFTNRHGIKICKL